eukprot:3877337-Heterocapsa_arctica.AAC.1
MGSRRRLRRPGGRCPFPKIFQWRRRRCQDLKRKSVAELAAWGDVLLRCAEVADSSSDEQE